MKKTIKSFLVLCFLSISMLSYGQTKVAYWEVEFLAINSLSDDFSPAFYRSGLIFTSNRNPGFAVKRVDTKIQKPFSSIYIVDSFLNIPTINAERYYPELDTVLAPNYSSTSSNDSKILGQYKSQKKVDSLVLKSNQLSHVRLADQFLQTKYHDGPVFYSSISDDFYITRNNYYRGKEQIGSNGNNNLQIYILKDIGGLKYDVREFPHNSDDYSNMHPTVSTDGQLMIFASDQVGGYGGLDLYYSYKQDTTWSKPINLGPQINTSKDDSFPFLDELGNLYFSSNRLNGAGNLDVYFVKLSKTEVMEKPEALGFAINTPFDDFGFIIKDGVGFVSSNRLGNDDIYKVRLKN